MACKLNIKATCGRARSSELVLYHATVPTPVFMPVGTQGSVKAMAISQLESLNCKIILGNTYHLGERPGPEQLKRLGGLHQFMRWPNAILTDSGGFQMVSLSKLSVVTEEGVTFQSPRDGTMSLLTPERSMEIQMAIGSDIIMALDDVVRPTDDSKRIAEASLRTVRWLDRCAAALPNNGRGPKQNLFAIVQGGLDDTLRDKCLEELIKRDTPGYAIGGLAGGESKDSFWRVIAFCCEKLPQHKPRYAMGIGYAEDMLVCVALGVDMFDCVYPTRTGRFGVALTDDGPMNLNHSSNRCMADTVITPGCPCTACMNGYSRALLNGMFAGPRGTEVAAQMVTHHNIAFQLGLMRRAKEAIENNSFAEFVSKWMIRRYGGKVSDVPQWIHDALTHSGISMAQFAPAPAL